jgi:AraC-like DNA-binding protein
VRDLARVDAPVELAAQAGILPALGAPKVVAQARDGPLEEEAPGGPRGAAAQAGEQGLPERREEDHQHACHAPVVPEPASEAKAARAESLVLRRQGGRCSAMALPTRARGVSANMAARLFSLAEQLAPPGARARLEDRARALGVLPGARMPYPVVDRLVTELGREAPLEVLGPTLARVRDAETYDVAGLLVLSSATYAEGLTRAFAHQRAWGDGERFRAARSADGHLALSFTHPSLSAEGRVAGAVLTECAFVELCDGLRWLVSPTSAPLACSVTHAPLGPGRRLEESLGCEVRFGASASVLTLARGDVDAPLAVPASVLSTALERFAALTLERVPAEQGPSLTPRVRSLLDAGLELAAGAGPPTLDQVARELSMSRRTVQRALADEGTSFEALLDDARRVRAESLLAEGHPKKEIAYVLGFADPSAFTRARRRWAGSREDGAREERRES